MRAGCRPDYSNGNFIIDGDSGAIFWLTEQPSARFLRCGIRTMATFAPAMTVAYPNESTPRK